MKKEVSSISKFIRDSAYKVEYEWKYIPQKIEEWKSEDRLQIRPDFQRDIVWTEEQQISYIEFCLKGGRTASNLYFNYPGWMTTFQFTNNYNDFVLVDGLQRLTAIIKFINNELEVFGGNLLRDYDVPKKLLNTTSTIHIHTLYSKAEVLKWYLELNSLGVRHTETEIARVQQMLDAELKR